MYAEGVHIILQDPTSASLGTNGVGVEGSGPVGMGYHIFLI